MILLPDSENRMIVASFISTPESFRRNVTEDRWTDTAVAYTAVALQAVRTRCKDNGIKYALFQTEDIMEWFSGQSNNAFVDPTLRSSGELRQRTRLVIDVHQLEASAAPALATK